MPQTKIGVSAISPTPISPTTISRTYYRSVPFRLLMQNVYKHIILTLLMPLIETIVVSHCFGHILQ